jgi:hypothetical protein
VRSIVTEIYLCHTGSCHEILRVETPRTDMAVSLLDTGETPVLPPFLSKLPGGGSVDLPRSTVDWIRSTTCVA